MTTRSITITATVDLDAGIADEDAASVLHEVMPDLAERYGADLIGLRVTVESKDEEGINVAHEHGRHESSHPEDIAAWAGLGCWKCQERMGAPAARSGLLGRLVGRR